MAELLAFNRGLLSRLGLARIDLKRTSLSAEVMTNWMPRVLGSMMLRPGLRYNHSTRSNLVAKLIPFIFSSTDNDLIEVTDSAIRITGGLSPLARNTITATISNGAFTSNLTGWTDADESGGASAWVTGGYMGLTGNGTNSAVRYQLVTVVESTDVHSLDIVIARGPVNLRIGSTIGGAEFLADTSLGVGNHSITFTPNANFYIQFSNASTNTAYVDSVAFSAGGAVTVAAPWGASILRNMRWVQSGDVIYVACKNVQPYKIERRSNDSWSVVKYQPADGPFLNDNITTTTLTASAISGSITVTASRPLFRSTNVGGLYRIRSVGQTVQADFTAEDSYTSTIRVTGVGESRRFGIVIGGTFSATLTLQYSVDEVTWIDHTTWTATTSETLLDGLDNQIIYYRIGVKTGDYTSGAAQGILNYSAGSITGIVRVTGYTSETVVDAEVVDALGGTAATADWSEGAWSDRRGWPTSVTIHDGRLWWAGQDRFWGSVTDQYETFDDEFEGDAGPISRSIGYGPVDTVNWLLSLNRLMAGTDGAEITCRSSSQNEPLTPTNFTPKNSSTQGSSSAVAALSIDNRALFIHRNGRRLYEMAYDGAFDDYMPEDLMALVPEIGDPGIVAMAVQRKPDTRIHCIRSDGTAAVLVFDRTENVICWCEVETDGEIEDVCVLPGAEEDAVYYVVKRTIDGDIVRYIELWAYESECRGGGTNKLADSFVFASSLDSTIGGLDHLEGETVVAWGGGISGNVGVYLGEFVVSGGSITLPSGHRNRMAGLPYTATFKSTKLAYADARGGPSGMTRTKKVNKLALILADTHPLSLTFGPSFDFMDPLPAIESYQEVDQDAVWEAYDESAIEFPGEWDTDSRVCLKASAPFPCTVLAAVIDVETR